MGQDREETNEHDRGTEAVSLLDYTYDLHLNVPEAYYHQPCLSLASSSSLKFLGHSPAHYRAWIDGNGREATDALRLGRAVHCAMLEPARFALEYAVMPDLSENGEYRTKAARDRKAEWIAARNGAPVLNEKDVYQVTGMVAAVLAHPDARAILEGGASEVTVRWKDAATGVECKARLDHAGDVVADLKSCDDASERGFTRACESLGYHFQDDFYTRGLAALGIDAPFRFVAVEKAPPFAIAVYEIDDEQRARAHVENSVRLMTLAECLRTGNWPGYPGGVKRIYPRVFP